MRDATAKREPFPVGLRAAVDFRVYLITDRRLAGGGDLLFRSGGVCAVQLREKDLGGRELLDLARRMRALTARSGAKLLINDRVDGARASAPTACTSGNRRSRRKKRGGCWARAG